MDGLDKIIARAAAGKQQRKPAARHAIDDFKQCAVAADGDDAGFAFLRGLPRESARRAAVAAS